MAEPRPFQFVDHAGVNALHRAVAWPERSAAGWRWMFANPARDADIADGWIIDGPDGPGAFLGNFVQRFWIDGRPHRTATGYSIIVSPALKGDSRRLIPAFVDQPGMAATFTLNANPLSAPLLKRYGMTPFPGDTGRLKLSWIVDPARCAVGRINRRIVGVWPGLEAREQLMSRRLTAPRPLRLPPDIRPLTDLSDGSPYDAFWRNLRGTASAMSDRSPATLRWRLADPDQSRAPLLLARYRAGAITAFAWAMLNKDTPLSAASLDVIDLVALDRDPDGVRALMSALLDNARGQGAARVRIQAVSTALLRQLGGLTRTARREGGWGHAHARLGPVLSAKASDWNPTPFDGDYSLCLRAPPVARAAAAAHAMPDLSPASAAT